MLITPFGRLDHGTHSKLFFEQCECHTRRYKGLESIVGSKKEVILGGLRFAEVRGVHEVQACFQFPQVSQFLSICGASVLLDIEIYIIQKYGSNVIYTFLGTRKRRGKPHKNQLEAACRQPRVWKGSSWSRNEHKK